MVIHYRGQSVGRVGGDFLVILFSSAWYQILRVKYSTVEHKSTIQWGGHHSDSWTSTVSDLLCNILPKHSPATCFEQTTMYLAERDVSKVTWFQEMMAQVHNS